MEIPDGYMYDRKRLVCKLSKAIYGLRQSPRTWNTKFSTSIKEMGFVQSQADPCIFIKYGEEKSVLAVIAIFVDDTIVLASPSDVEGVKSNLMQLFKMRDLGP